MGEAKTTPCRCNKFLAVVGISLALATTGCQVHVGGQTLPSPYYMEDDVQYFAPGPEFKLSNEAAALQKYQSEQGLP